MKIGQKAICTRLNGDKFTVEVDEINDYYKQIRFKVLDGEHKNKRSILAFDELDSSIEQID